MEISVDILSNSVIADISRKISELDMLSSLGTADSFLIERSTPIEVQFEILKELESKVSAFIICLEDGFLSDEPSTQKYLINETMMTLWNACMRSTNNLSYDDLARTIVRDLSSAYNFGTMAFRDKHEYSKVWHSHNDMYTLVDVKPDYQTSSVIATVELEDSSQANAISICLPKDYGEISYTADIGEIKFIANPIKTFNINADDFDGWVLADGSWYNKDMFPEAYEIFNPLHTSNMFQVPCLSNFVKLNNFSNSIENKFETVKHKNAIRQHTHGDFSNSQIADVGTSISVTINLPICYKSGGSYNAKAMHTSYEKPVDKLTSLSIVIDTSQLKSSATNTERLNEDIESVPLHHVVPAMIYIGKKINAE